MDDIRRPQSSTEPRAFNTTPVTDIAGVAPRASAPNASVVHAAAPAPSPVPSVTTEAPAPVDVPIQDAAPPSNPMPAPVQSAAFAQNPPAPQATSGSLLAEIEAQEKTEAESRVQQAPTAPRPKRHGWFPIVMAIIIALGLLAGAGYAYWQNNKQTKAPAQSTTTVTEKKPATAADVDAITKSLDESIESLAKTQDLAETDLADAALGL